MIPRDLSIDRSRASPPNTRVLLIRSTSDLIRVSRRILFKVYRPRAGSRRTWGASGEHVSGGREERKCATVHPHLTRRNLHAMPSNPFYEDPRIREWHFVGGLEKSSL